MHIIVSVSGRCALPSRPIRLKRVLPLPLILVVIMFQLVNVKTLNVECCDVNCRIQKCKQTREKNEQDIK